MQTAEGYALHSLRRTLLRDIKRLIKPHLHESSYRKGPAGSSQRLKVWIPSGENEQALSGLLIETFYGVTEDGLITDTFCGAIVTTYWASTPTDDLLRLRNWLKTKLPSKKGVAG